MDGFGEYKIDDVLDRRLLPAIRAVLCVLLTWCSTAQARDFTERFTGPKTSWKIEHAGERVRVARHQRIRRSRKFGPYEYVKFESGKRGAKVRLSHSLPAAQVIAELKLSLRWISGRNGAVLSLRVVFPRHRDPETGRVLTTLIDGDRYTAAGKWQSLKCGVTERQVAARIREFRERYNDSRISSAGMYVDAAILSFIADPGTVHTGIADLRFGPIVSPKQRIEGTVRQIEETSEQSEPSGAKMRHPVEFRLDRMRVDGYPFLPRMTPYHNESPQDLRAGGCNVIWVPRYDDRKLLAKLRGEGLWMTATPPGGPVDRDANNHSVQAIEAFDEATAPILFWNVGTRIPVASRKKLTAWVDRIQQADRLFDRPILGDVVGEERVFSRHVSMLGVSRHILHTSFSPREYRDWLIQKRKLARPGSFLWTWIQTEPAGGAFSGSRDGDSTAVVEPEQIRLQVYAALAAGCRGIGYWKTTPLDSRKAGAAERRLMITQLNLELDLLAPWISTGTVVAQSAFAVAEPDVDKISRRRLDFRTGPDAQEQRRALLKARQDRQKRRAAIAGELQAAVIRSEYGTLLLPVWYQTDAQFVPGRMTANNARITVHGISASASAWLISTTGIHSLVRKRVTGGIQITIPKFDQTAAIILTSNRRLIEQLRQRVRQIAPQSADILVKLARRKYERVRKVDAALSRRGQKQPDAPQLLQKAAAFLSEANSALRREDYRATGQLAGNVMQLLRILQRAHWNDAVRRFASPVGSPYAVCFQTLPQHWDFIARFGRSQPTEETALRSGDFEDIDTMVAEGWKHTQNAHPAVRAVAELYPKGKKGHYSLRLVAAPVPGKDPPTYLARPPVTVTSPPITARSGQIVHISGWVQVATPVVGSLDGGMVYDSLSGLRGALRWKTQTGWRRFSMLREVDRSGSFRLTLMLGGMGEIRFDDLQVRLHDPPVDTLKNDVADSDSGRPRSLLDRFPKLPSLPSIPGFGRPRTPPRTR